MHTQGVRPSRAVGKYADDRELRRGGGRARARVKKFGRKIRRGNSRREAPVDDASILIKCKKLISKEFGVEWMMNERILFSSLIHSEFLERDL